MANQNCSPSQLKGFAIEKIACDYLEKHDLKLIQKNFRTKYGEIDLIMEAIQYHQKILAFTEVRYRKSASFGGALESINWAKQKKLIHTAQIYLLKYHKLNPPMCRFDVVLLSGQLSSPNIEWIVNAFECD